MLNSINDINNENLKEEELELFDKFSKICKLFNVDAKIHRSYKGTSYAEITTKKIGIDFKKGESDENLDRLVFENIDKFHNDKHKELYKKCPSLIKYFLHEVGHLATMSEADLLEYQVLKWDAYESSHKGSEEEKDRAYRNISYEKLADNLSSEFYYNNYDTIVKILLGKRVRITKKRIENNLKVIKDMRDKYIEFNEEVYVWEF